MSSNPHLFMLAKAMRTRPLSIAPMTVQSAVRGGGGGFHKPDPKPWKPYNHTRVVALEDINTILYHDTNPEYHLHLHAMWVQNARQGWALFWSYTFLVIVPIFVAAFYTHRRAGSNLSPCVRPGKDHEHMAPKLIRHLKANNYESAPDFLGRRNAQFYKNYCRQVNDFELRPTYVKWLELHGFKF